MDRRRRRSAFSAGSLAGLAALTVVLLALSPASAAPSLDPLDPTFGNAGRGPTDFGGFAGDAAVALDTTGRISAAGHRDHDDFAVARYLPDGAPDPSFDGDGKLTSDFAGPFEEASSVAIQRDGKIVVAGYAR